MKITFRTNLDTGPEQFPENLPYPPSVGDLVYAKSGLVLRVVDRYWYDDRIEIELHMPVWFESIKQWEKWYQSRSGF